MVMMSQIKKAKYHPGEKPGIKPNPAFKTGKTGKIKSMKSKGGNAKAGKPVGKKIGVVPVIAMGASKVPSANTMSHYQRRAKIGL